MATWCDLHNATARKSSSAVSAGLDLHQSGPGRRCRWTADQSAGVCDGPIHPKPDAAAVESHPGAAVRQRLDGACNIRWLENDPRFVLRVQHQPTECATAECAAAATGNVPAMESGAVHVHGRLWKFQSAPTGIA